MLLSSLYIHAGERIIALSPALNELVYTLGSGDKMVGNTTYCDFPKEAQKLTRVGGYFEPSLERILALKPTMVLLEENNIKLTHTLEQLHISTHVFSVRTLPQIQKTIHRLGEILKQQAKASHVLADINTHLDLLKGILHDKRILIVIGAPTSLEKQIFVVGQNLYFDDIITHSGNINAFSSMRVGQPILNMENIIATQADIVIVLAPYMKEKHLSKETLIAPWLKLPITAAKTKHIYVVGEHYAGITSDRLVYFLRDFKRFLDDASSR